MERCYILTIFHFYFRELNRENKEFVKNMIKHRKELHGNDKKFCNIDFIITLDLKTTKRDIA